MAFSANVHAPRTGGHAAGSRARASLLSAAMLALTLPGVASAQDPAPAAPQAQAAPERFLITAFDVSGVTKLSDAEIERLIYPFVGPDRSNDDVIAARKALQAAYAAKGYEAVLVDVPIQPAETFSAGIVQIAVNETPVGRVRVVDSKYHALSVVRAQVPSLVEGQPLDLKALQREVTAANRFPDRAVDPVFRPGQTPGTIDVDLKVEDEPPYHASVELNNDNNPNTVRLRLTSTARFTNLWELGHEFTTTYTYAPEDTSQSRAFSGSYRAPFLNSPWSVLIYGYVSDSDIASLGGTNVLGNGGQIGLRAVYRLPSEDSSQSISFGPDFKAFDQDVVVNNVIATTAPIRYVPVVAEYGLSGADERSNYGLSLGVTAGLRVIGRDICIPQSGTRNIPRPGARDLRCTIAGTDGLIDDQFQNRALDARENFVHVNTDINYSTTLPYDLSLALRFSGQLGNGSLVTNEQFSIGGMDTVRGYFLSEVIGDDGFVESAELRSPDLATTFGGFVDEFRIFAFGDVGYARVRALTAGQQQSFRLASFGGGLRFRLLDYVAGEALIGVPVADGPTTRSGDPRYSFSIKGEF